MIFFQDLNNISQQDKQKFIQWKADIELCDLIMSKPMNLSLGCKSSAKSRHYLLKS